MTKFEIIENGEVVGFADTDALEYEYTGQDEQVRNGLERLGTYVGGQPGYQYGSPPRLEGEMADASIREMAEDDMTDIAVRVTDEK
jgi:hypothetical protein